jgi:hypothetical protein
VTAPQLTFLAAPTPGGDSDEDTCTPTPVWPASPSRAAAPGARGGTEGALPMTRGAREAARGMDVSDADVQHCLDAPDDVSPDPTTPARTRFRRGTLVVLVGPDGMVLRVQRRGR